MIDIQKCGGTSERGIWMNTNRDYILPTVYFCIFEDFLFRKRSVRSQFIPLLLSLYFQGMTKTSFANWWVKNEGVCSDNSSVNLNSHDQRLEVEWIMSPRK